MILLLKPLSQIGRVINPTVGGSEIFQFLPFLVTGRNTATGRWRVNIATVTTASVNMASAPRGTGREAAVGEARVTDTDAPKYTIKYSIYYITIIEL